MPRSEPPRCQRGSVPFGIVEPRNQRQQAIVDAVLRMLDGLRFDDVIPSTRRIARECGQAPQTVAGAFASRHDLLMRTANPGSLFLESDQDAVERLLTASDLLARSLGSLKPGGVAQLIERFSEGHLRELSDLRNPRRRLLFAWAGLPSTQSGVASGGSQDDGEQQRRECAGAVSSVHRKAMDAYAEQYERVLESWGRKVRAPLDLDGLVVLLNALTEGFRLVLAFDGTVDPTRAARIYAQGVLAILASATCPPEDDRTIAEVLDPVDPS